MRKPSGRAQRSSGISPAISLLLIVLLLCPARPAARAQAAGPEAAVGAALAGTTVTRPAPFLGPAADPAPMTTVANTDPSATAVLYGPPSPPPPPRLALAVRAAPEAAAAGETVTVTVRLANQGGPATGVVLSGMLPGGLDLRYAYDLAGNVVEIEDWIAGSPQTQAFGYDALNRLITATASGASGEGGYGPEGYHYNEIGNITMKGDLAYGYQDAAHAHAVTHLTYLQQNDQRYWYDANGNQVKRIMGGETYTLTYDAENHLTAVVTAGGTLAAFGYGPGGERITGTVGVPTATTTVYVGAHYEVQTVGATEVVREYYYAGAQRVAMREGGTLYFLLADHLGSQAVTAEADGDEFAEVRYKAWGEDRYTSGATPTSFRYTGQRAESLLGLYYYGARWYDPALGRFAQADTIVPGAMDPQNMNRYSYASNNP